MRLSGLTCLSSLRRGLFIRLRVLSLLAFSMLASGSFWTSGRTHISHHQLVSSFLLQLRFYTLASLICPLQLVSTMLLTTYSGFSPARGEANLDADFQVALGVSSAPKIQWYAKQMGVLFAVTEIGRVAIRRKVRPGSCCTQTMDEWESWVEGLFPWMPGLFMDNCMHSWNPSPVHGQESMTGTLVPWMGDYHSMVDLHGKKKE